MIGRVVLATACAMLATVCGATGQQTLRQLGGLVSKEGTGRLLIVNCQDCIRPEAVRAKAEYLSRLLGIRADVTTNAAERATLTIFLTDDGAGGAPVPDAHMGVVGMDRLRSGDAAMRKFNAEFARIAADLFVPERVNVNRREIEDVFVGEAFTMMAVNTLKRLLPQAGFEPAIIATYETACREGWAPAPTNDVQKAIWAKTLDEKERGPTNPITIPPPKKK